MCRGERERKPPPFPLMRRRQLTSMSDDDLIIELSRLNSAAMDVLVERHQRAVWGLAMRVLNDEHAAKDIAQNVFINLWRRAAQYESSRGSVRSWLLGATRNAAIDELRRSERQLRGPVTSPEQMPEFGRGEAASPSTTDALAGLPLEQQRVLWMAVYGGYTHFEIAELLNVPLGTVKSRMRLGMEKLKTQMEVSDALPL